MTTTTTVPVGSFGLIPAAPHITDRVVLAASTVHAGTTIEGTLVVTNGNSEPVNLTQECEPDFAVAINNAVIKQAPAFAAACSAQPLILHPGINRFPISVITTYFGCLQAGGSSESSMPRCTASGAPALPAGSYHTVLYGSGNLSLPEPASVTVTLTD